VLAQQRDAGVADLLGDQHARRAHTLAAHAPLQDVVDAGGQRLHVGRVGRGEHRDPQLVAPELAVGLDVDDPVGAQRRRERGGVDASSKSIVPTTSERLAGSATNGSSWGRRLGPAVQVREESVVRATMPVEAAAASIQSIWSASRNSVAIAGVL
jgi:hypothetical protein